MNIIDTIVKAVSSPWEDDTGPAQLLFEQIEVSPIDDHLTMGLAPEILSLV